MEKVELKWNKDLYKNRLDLIPIILEKDKALYDYYTNGNNGKYSPAKAKKMWVELNNLYKEINKANNIYYHEDKWIDDYCSDTFKNLGLTGEKLVDYVINELNKLDGVVVRLYHDKETYTDYKGNKYRSNVHNYTIYVITPTKTYEYNIKRGYNGYFTLDPKGPQWTNQKLVYKHICELLYDGIDYDNEYRYKDILKKDGDK